MIKFTKEFKQRWVKYYLYRGSPVEQVKVSVVANTNRTVESFFIDKNYNEKY